MRTIEVHPMKKILIPALLLVLSSTVAVAQKGGTVGDPNNPTTVRLLSPHAGDVLVPGQTVAIRWERTFGQDSPPLNTCEQEIYLSLDGGTHVHYRITPSLPAAASNTIYWRVPNTPTGRAVLDLRFGCYDSETHGHETVNPMRGASFRILSPHQGFEFVSQPRVSAGSIASGSAVTLSWDSTALGVDHYEVLSSFDHGDHFVSIGSTPDTSLAWSSPSGSYGSVLFKVVAHKLDGTKIDSVIPVDEPLTLRPE